MTTGLAVDNGPYALPVPVPDTPVVLPQWISPGNTHPNSRYQDLVWLLAPLIDNPSTSLVKILWRDCPTPLRDQVKLAAWTMVNGQHRPTYLRSQGNQARPRTSALDMQDTCREWIRLARWLHKRRITSLATCTGDQWRAYVSERLDGVSRGYAEAVCRRLTDLWAFDQLSARPVGITRPPWDSEGVDDFLPAADGTSGGENATVPLDPKVLGPLLVWAIRFVDDFADDILAAWAENRRLTASAIANKATPASWRALEELLLPHARTGASLPAIRMNGGMTLACTYISALTGASRSQVDRFSKRHGLSATAAQQPGPCPLQAPVAGEINGRAWREHMDFDEASELMRHWAPQP